MTILDANNNQTSYTKMFLLSSRLEKSSGTIGKPIASLSRVYWPVEGKISFFLSLFYLIDRAEKIKFCSVTCFTSSCCALLLYVKEKEEREKKVGKQIEFCRFLIQPRLWHIDSIISKRKRGEKNECFFLVFFGLVS